jgi:outer membrane protein insertion porin family
MRIPRLGLLVRLALFACVTFPPSSAQASERPLVVETIEVEGNTRTDEDLLFRYLGLAPGDEAAPDSIARAVEVLRGSGLFRSVEVESRPGSARGRLALRLVVEEKGPELRLGAGYQDLSGWYLIPAEVRLDNRLGRGEQTRVQARLGYRTAGVHASYEEPGPPDGRFDWGLAVFGTGGQRVYFADGVEYRHDVSRGGVEGRAGWRPGKHWRCEGGAGVEGIEADSSAEAGEENEARGIERGDALPFEELPAGIASDLGKETRGFLRADLTWDSRSACRVAGTPASGIWGRARLVGTFPGEGGAFPALTADVRAYRALGSVALALRARGGAMGPSAPWYDRFYVGGLYTARGFPSQALSDPAGETRFAAASLEVRGTLAGRDENPRLVGVLFIDAADAWSDDASVTLDGVSAGAGWGLRLRVPWVGWVGLDAGVPLTESPVREAFHGNASIGMTY